MASNRHVKATIGAGVKQVVHPGTPGGGEGGHSQKRAHLLIRRLEKVAMGWLGVATFFKGGV